MEGSLYQIEDVPLETALAAPDSNSNRVSPWQTISRGVDTRSGNIILRDASYNRLIAGNLPDGTFGLVISKTGIDVLTLFT